MGAKHGVKGFAKGLGKRMCGHQCCPASPNDGYTINGCFPHLPPPPALVASMGAKHGVKGFAKGLGTRMCHVRVLSVLPCLS
jgi:hypothetical protein